jgi:Cof subfamily protein (haloacid dehalogenase superfamily)
MRYKLFAFDLDGTLLDDRKLLSPANTLALREIAAAGGVIAFATGRIGSSVDRYLPFGLGDVALLTLNGAEVWTGSDHGSSRIYYAPLSSSIADFLIDYGRDREFALNYYIDGKLYAVRTENSSPWIDLYVRQTSSTYRFETSLDRFKGRLPSKIIFVGSKPFLDEQERQFRALWGESVYICRTWDYYLEFLDPKANKASGLEALAHAYGIELSQVAAFGDSQNDIPMLQRAGLGVAMANAGAEVKSAASRVSKWTNNEDGIAREWEEIKKMKDEG